MAAIKQSPVPPPPPLSFCEGPRILQNLRDVVFQIVELPLYILSFLVPDPTSLFPPDLILYANLIAKRAPKFFKTLPLAHSTVLDIPYFADAYLVTL